MNTSHFSLPNGATLSYKEYGNPAGKAVIVLHGLAGSIAGESMEEQLKDLPLRLVYLARPGYGESEYFEMTKVADWAWQLPLFFEQLQLESFDVLGISAGAPYACSLAAHYPQRVRAVYINSGVPAIYHPDILACYPMENKEVYKQFNSMTKQQVGQLIYNAYKPMFSEEMMQSMDFIDAMGGDLMNIGQESKLQIIDWGFDVANIHKPVYMFHGTKDDVVPYEAAKAMAEMMPYAKLIMLNGEPHSSDKATRGIFEMLMKQ